MTFDDYARQGIGFFQNQEFEKALESFKAAQNLNPGNQDIQQFIMMAEAQLSFKAQAYQAAANEAKSRAEVMGIKVEDVDKAIAENAEALKRSPNDDSIKGSLANFYYIRGLTFTSKGERAKAIADYSEAIKNNPNYPHAISKRGQEYMENSDFDKAIADFEELIRISPDYNMAKDMLGNVYMKRGMMHYQKQDCANAIPDFEKALQLKPDNPDIREILEMAKAEM